MKSEFYGEEYGNNTIHTKCECGRKHEINVGSPSVEIVIKDEDTNGLRRRKRTLFTSEGKIEKED